MFGKQALLVLSVMVPALAGAQSIEEKQNRAAGESLVADSVKSMNKVCKTEIPTDGVIDWASWKSAVNEKGKKANYPCGYVAYGMESLCRDKIAQETVAKDVKKLRCLGDGSGEEVKFELKDGTLVFHTHYEMRDTDKQAKKWLSKNLQ
jgi:hypothetical protein